MMYPYQMPNNWMGAPTGMEPGYPMAGQYLNAPLVKTIQDCEATCEHMIHHLNMHQFPEPRGNQAILLRDCADICGLTANFIARGSVFAKYTAALCACVCQTCGQECARFPDQMSQNCARVCLNCAQACGAFASSL